MKNILWLGLVGCAYDAPIVPPTDASGDEIPVLNVISGEILLATTVETPGHVIVFATDAANPMPPYGTGRPITISTVPASEFTDVAVGMRSAPFTVSGVPDGEWVLTALMDIDGDFNPLSLGMSGSTCGDVGGAYLTDLTTRALAPVQVADGQLVADITITLASVFPLERPSFSVTGFGAGGGVVDPSAATPGFALTSMGIHSELVELAGPEAFGTAACGTIFPLYAPDSDDDGAFDPHPTYGEAGLADVWPRIYATWLGEPILSEDGVTFNSTLEAGESWTAEHVPSPAYVMDGTLTPGSYAYEAGLDVLWMPIARHTYLDANGTPTSEVITDPAEIPSGAWSITVVSFTGQSWTVPNDLAAYESTDPDFDPLSQLAWLTVQ